MQAHGVEIRFPGNHAAFAQAFARLREALDDERLNGAARYNIELVFEEIVSNIIHYGAVDGREPDVCVRLDAGADEVVLIFEDDGIPFDSTARTERPSSTSLEDARIGGFGLILVRGAASSLSYRRTVEDRNQLTVAIRRDTGGLLVPAAGIEPATP